MTVNPNDYNPDELRGGPSGSSETYLGRSHRSGGGAFGRDGGTEASQSRELFLLERASTDGSMEKPYLSSFPRSYAAEMVVFEWLEFLLDQAGFRETLDVLRYYRSIDWITADVERRLREYLQSFDAGRGRGRLSRTEHLQSLVFIARLAAMD